MLVRTRQLDHSGGEGLPIAPGKRPGPRLPNEFCRSASPSRVRDVRVLARDKYRFLGTTCWLPLRDPV
jgi:hypothetical protein